ncbi:LiaF transmembrane domain-containing protein [Halovivax gelatinilyticus]|uniref:LiaF transmembrane domain-containing protein n=1 Tax=Halovivax gelatinilyticus TaxID=2961597 RepID=UPI0020CA3C6D|nr:DUF5668 domain-containing protein [Halovivax gelatinilyticus]
MTQNLWERLTTGGIVILIGVFLLLATTGVLEMRALWEWVPLLFVLLGIWALVRSEFRNLVGPVMVIAIAGAFFVRNLGLISDDAIGTWWPLFIVLLGVLIVVNRSRGRQRLRLTGDYSADEIRAIGVFGTDERRVTSDHFTGAELVSVFGDARLDLRDGSVQSTPAIVESVTVFGDTEIRVPQEWDVRLEVLNILADSIDRRSVSSDKRAADDGPDLVVTGIAVFADLEIRD